MDMNSLDNLRRRYFGEELKQQKIISNKIQEGLRRALDNGQLSVNSSGFLLKTLAAAPLFFANLDRILAYDEWKLKQEADVTKNESKLQFANRAEQELYSAAKDIFEARSLISLAQASTALSSDPNQFHANPSRPRDIDESYRPLFELIDKVQRFAEEEIMPLLSSQLKSELNLQTDIAISFDVDSKSPGQGIEFIKNQALLS